MGTGWEAKALYPSTQSAKCRLLFNYSECRLISLFLSCCGFAECLGQALLCSSSETPRLAFGEKSNNLIKSALEKSLPLCRNVDAVVLCTKTY